MVTYPVEVYGFVYGEKSHAMAYGIGLEGLVGLKSNVYLGSVTNNWSEAELRVIKWLKAEGIEVDLWNSLGTSGPVSYSVATA